MGCVKLSIDSLVGHSCVILLLCYHVGIRNKSHQQMINVFALQLAIQVM